MYLTKLKFKNAKLLYFYFWVLGYHIREQKCAVTIELYMK